MSAPVSPPSPGGRAVHVCATTSAVAAQLGDLVARLAGDAVRRHGKFTIALSGGSLPAVLARDLKKRAADVHADKWEVWYADERCVPLTHPDSNHALCHQELYTLLPALRNSRIHAIDDSLAGNPEACAAAYDRSLRAHFRDPEDLVDAAGGKLPVFDAIFLGMGPDGHTASLFPGHPVADFADASPWILPITDSPKPPPSRVTMTLPVINAARNVVFVCTGEGKREAVRSVLQEGDAGIPSARVAPKEGVLRWWLDEAAAGLLDREKVAVADYRAKVGLPPAAPATPLGLGLSVGESKM
ncbi:glucosamine-6-phosphate isomerases/6-phosphogluconolactonase-domain-containing protein [Hyaloraphidium curvatum]|nr:glucosamine-6-phosphate isomerases/6-phosphogluconolactonase-domain-containing protein [Hyaloraphidium curvatum]